MQPIHCIDYELTRELAADVESKLLPWELRRGWRRDAPTLAGALGFAVLIISLGMQGWILPGVGGGLLCLLTFFVMLAVLRRRSHSRAALSMALLAVQTSDRRVHLDFAEESVTTQMEYFRGEGAWTELDDVVTFDTFWVLQFASGGQIVIPVAALSPQVEDFIRVKAQQVMAPVHKA